MSECYKCNVYEDYTDQFAVPQGAACWNCYYKYHMTDEQRRNSDCFNKLNRIRIIIDLPAEINAETKVNLIESDASLEKIYKLKKLVEEVCQQARNAVLAKLTYEERKILEV